MAKDNEKQTIIFDKNIKGKRESAPVDNQSQQSKPETKPDSAQTSKRNIGKILELIIIMLIVLFSLCVATYTLLDALNIINPQENSAQLATTTGTSSNSSSISSTSTSASPSSQTTSASSANGSSSSTGNTSSSGSITTPDPAPLSGGIDTVNKTYTYAAARGQGVTHLARQAMNQYLAEKNINLTPQQKLYFVAHLVRVSNPKGLRVGETRSFKTSDLERINRNALSQTPAQQARWNKYI